MQELVLLEIPVALCVCGSQSLLQGHPLVGEGHSSNVLENLVGSAQGCPAEVLDFFLVHLLEQSQLDDPSIERVQVVQDRVDFEVAEVVAQGVNHLLEVLDKALSCTEARELYASIVSRLQEGKLESMLSEVVCEPLDALLGPSLDAFQELALVLVMEFLDASLELDLGRAQGLDLLELLQVEEGLRHRELVAAPRRGQEALELGSVGQLQDEVVDFSQRLGIHILQLFPLENCLHEQGSDLGDVAVLQLHLREDLLNGLLKVLLENGDKLSASGCDELFALLEDEWRDDVIVMQSRHFDLNSLYSISANESDLSVSPLLPLRLSEFQGNKPLDLGLDLRILWVGSNVWKTEASEGIARGIVARVHPLDLFHGDVAASLFSLERLVVPRSHHCVWVVAWVCQLIASAHGVEELDRLICARSDDELGFGQVANVHNRRVVS